MQEDSNEVGDGMVPLPCVRVPLLKVPLTKRSVSNNLFDDLLPEPDQVPSQSRW